MNNSIFQFPGLQAHTLYCLQSVGLYSVVEQLKSYPEMTRGGSMLIRTEGEMNLLMYMVEDILYRYVFRLLLYYVTTEGVPDPPFIRLRDGMESILEWETPNTRGRDIIFYRVLAM